jgi:hypothetical protein
MDEKFCYDCIALDPKELDQTNKKEKHICKIWKEIVFHEIVHHPNIVRCNKCQLYKTKEIIDILGVKNKI